NFSRSADWKVAGIHLLTLETRVKKFCTKKNEFEYLKKHTFIVHKISRENAKFKRLPSLIINKELPGILDTSESSTQRGM
ncbi:MAG: hypothetical protein QNL04_11030, partial [SAR324 cluster bacterium]|nr:hypothetical protein [SAR324 cluster bacterium]